MSFVILHFSSDLLQIIGSGVGGDKKKKKKHVRRKAVISFQKYFYRMEPWQLKVGRMVYCTVIAAQMVVGSSPKPPPMLVQVCGPKRLSCYADLYTVSRCHTRGESEDHTSEKTCKGSLKPRADLTRIPKQGYQWPHEKGSCPSKFF